MFGTKKRIRTNIAYTYSKNVYCICGYRDERVAERTFVWIEKDGNEKEIVCVCVCDANESIVQQEHKATAAFAAAAAPAPATASIVDDG